MSKIEELPSTRCLPSVCSFIKTQYFNPKRLHSLLIPTIAAGVLYLTSEELWTMLNGKSIEIPMENINLYCSFFLAINLLIYYAYYRRLHRPLCFTILVSTFSLFFDLIPITAIELGVLYTINELPKDTSSILGTLLLGALPACLGVLSIESVTSDNLDEKIEKLFESIDEIKESRQEIDKKIKMVDEKYVEHRKLMDKIYERLKKRGESK